MLEEEIEIACPNCSPADETWHEVIKPGQSPIAKCMDCGHVHGYRIPKVKMKTVKIIVSNMGETVVMQMLLPEQERFFIEEEFVVEDVHTGEITPIIITAIEFEDKRKPSAPVKEIDTIWGRAIDSVTVKIAIQQGETTDSQEIKVPGDFKFTVGQNVRVDGKDYPIVSIKIRGGGFKSREGDYVLAKKIKRVYAKKPRFGTQRRY
ncbi:MAG: HVO_0476 family zinc finger protein [Methanimicrococcus sp.]|nr:HVO_0476 family zinc finger protein [Methanimicrococcus sp.]